ncbi:Heterokaryon incompatibility protein 6, OR allele [Cytospora mali]|uniref:Heterokaryon incompatibility protein 6, OR allele n=1 Tax=Cytospora mali TaxID=578113 RepID=A0A194US69_CYTMA|nr:Heterokaryon incompatibility protein 6, OR allele [Valsa mali var. pyri (nom. inval.)]
MGLAVSSLPLPEYPVRLEPPDNTTFIRLLEVLDVNESDAVSLKCQLTTWPIQEMPSYHAISYTWGDPNLTATIILNGQRLEVRQNCEYVLKQAHWHGGSRYHWVDAICIDQNNPEEKAKQVAMMGYIYQRAAHVLACVGPHAEDSDLIYDTVAKLVINDEIEAECASMWEKVSDKRRLSLAMVAFSKRQYFSRLWVLQELFHAPVVSFLCGKSHMRCEILYALFHILQGGDPHDHADDAATSSCLSHAKRLFTVARDEPVGKLLDLPKLTSGMFCQDPRDKVYAIISMADWHRCGVSPIIPDYTKTMLEVAMEYVGKLNEINSRRHQSLTLRDQENILRGLGLSNQSEGVYSAIKARQRYPEEEHMPRNDTPLTMTTVNYRGRCILQEEMDDNFRLLIRGDSPDRDDVKILLPRQTQPGDWLIKIYFQSLVVVAREGPQGQFAIIGKCVVDKGRLLCSGTIFRISIDVEDMIVLILSLPKKEDIKSDDWKREYLRTRVCRTPGSSYAIPVEEK